MIETCRLRTVTTWEKLANGNWQNLQVGPTGALPALPTSPNSVSQYLNTTPAGGLGVSPVWGLPGVQLNAQTATPYTIAATDRLKIVTFSNAGAFAVTLPQAGTGGGTNNDFTSNFTFGACNIGAGTVTITPTVSTISFTNGSSYTNAATSMAIATGQCATIRSGDNVNYFADLRTGGSGGFAGTVTYTANQTASTSDNQKLVILNCSSACTYTLPATQPSTTWQTYVVTIGSTNATIALGGSDTFNGTTSVPVLNKFKLMFVAANSATATDYEGDAPLVAGAGISTSPSANGFSLSTSLRSNQNTSATTNFGSAITNQAIRANEFFLASAVHVYVFQKTAGVGCSAASNTVSVVVNFTDPNGNTQTVQVPLQAPGVTFATNFTITGNGSVANASNNFAVGTVTIGANNSSATETITTTSTLASTGCTTTPQYVVVTIVVSQ